MHHTQQNISNGISATVAAYSMLQTGRCHITLSPVKYLPPCDAAFHQNSGYLSTFFLSGL